MTQLRVIALALVSPIVLPLAVLASAGRCSERAGDWILGRLDALCRRIERCLLG